MRLCVRRFGFGTMRGGRWDRFHPWPARLLFFESMPPSIMSELFDDRDDRRTEKGAGGTLSGTAAVSLDAPHSASEFVYLGRQPILDRSGALNAYELLFRDSAHNHARVSD